MRLGLFLAAVVVFAGCGSSSADRHDKSVAGVRATAHALLKSLLDRDYDGVCALLTPAARATIADEGRRRGGASSCPSGSAYIVGSPARGKVADKLIDSVKVTINGNRARSAPLPGDPDPDYYVYRYGRWSIALDPADQGAAR